MYNCSKCNQNKQPSVLPPKVLEIVNPEQPVLFHKVIFPASIGDDKEYPADTLDYKNVLLEYQANGHVYLYSSDGVPTMLPTNDVDEIVKQLEALGAKVEELEQSNAEILGQVKVLEEQTSSLNEATDNLTQVTDNLTDSVGDLARTTDKLTNDLAGLGSQVTSNSTDIAGLQTATGSNSDKIEFLETNVSKNAQDISALNTDLSTTNNNLNSLQTEVTEVKSNLTNEIAERTNADTAINTAIAETQSQVDTLKTNLNTDVEQSTAFNGNDSTLDVVHTKINLSNNETKQTTDALPVASSTQAGIMNAATFTAVKQNSDNIDSILVGAVALDNLPENPTQDQLTTAWKTATGKTELVNRASIYDVTNQKNWDYYANTNTWYSSASGEGSIVTVNQATNTSLGIVKGSELEGQNFVEADGTMSVNGWDETKERIANLESSMEIENIRTQNLPAQVVYNTAPVEYTDTTVKVNSLVKDLHTGGDASIGVVLNAATDTKAGVITAEQNQGINEVITQYPVMRNDLTDAMGDIAAIEADFVRKSQLLNTYSTATDNANSASFIKSKLNSDKVVLGESASETGGRDVAIGALATGGGTNPSNRNVAIGASSGGAYNNTFKYTVALGYYSTVNREAEVSFGNGTDTAWGRRYLANVRAGELDTDAVNKKQMEDYVAENAPVYTLPIASATELGGVKVGANLQIDTDGVLSTDMEYMTVDEFNAAWDAA